MKKQILKIVAFTLIALLIICVGMAWLVYNGLIQFNHPSTEKYPVRGVDVSAYQGEIDWDVLAGQGIDFAFIKATEGSSFTDRKFATNYENAIKTDLRVGAYHFFSFDSAGSTQAENFIKAVYSYENMLPPVVDVEFYGDYLATPPQNVDAIKKELQVLLEALEEEYEMSPIIYATQESYALFLENDFAEYDIWIRDIFTSPKLLDGREWTFWQYTNRGQMDGYDGEEKFIDINVFAGTKEEFEKYER